MKSDDIIDIRLARSVHALKVVIIIIISYELFIVFITVCDHAHYINEIVLVGGGSFIVSASIFSQGLLLVWKVSVF